MMNLESLRARTEFDSSALVTKGLIKKEKKGILKRVRDHHVTIVRNPSILMILVGRFTVSHQTRRRNLMRRVMPTKLKATNRGSNLP